MEIGVARGGDGLSVDDEPLLLCQTLYDDINGHARPLVETRLSQFQVVSAKYRDPRFVVRRHGINQRPITIEDESVVGLGQDPGQRGNSSRISKNGPNLVVSFIKGENHESFCLPNLLQNGWIEKDDLLCIVTDRPIADRMTPFLQDCGVVVA